MSNMEQRIRQLEDFESLRYLKHYFYCHCVDRAVAGDSAAVEEMATHFSDDIVADFTGFPLAEGKSAVMAFYRQGVPSFLCYSQHRVMNEVIDIHGETATGRWYLDCPVIFRPGNPLGIEGAGLIMGRYEEEYALIDGVWKWTKIVALLDVQSSQAQGWQGAQLLRGNR